jgi:hypothetical protein
VEYAEKCPPLLAEKPVYIKNAFWAKLCVTRTYMCEMWRCYASLQANLWVKRHQAVVKICRLPRGTFIARDTENLGGDDLPDTHGYSNIQGTCGSCRARYRRVSNAIAYTRDPDPHSDTRPGSRAEGPAARQSHHSHCKPQRDAGARHATDVTPGGYPP